MLNKYCKYITSESVTCSESFILEIKRALIYKKTFFT